MRALQHQTHTQFSTRTQWQRFTTTHIKHNRATADHPQKPWQVHRAQAPSTSTAVTSDGSEPPKDTSAELEVPEGIAEPMSQEAVASEKQRQKKLWFAAVKPPMYTVSIIPILVSNTAPEVGTKIEALPSLLTASLFLSAGFCCSCVRCIWDAVPQQMLATELSVHTDHRLAQS